MTTDFRVCIREIGEVAALLELAGEIDLSTAALLEAQFRYLVDRGLTDVVIDATEVTFMDSSGLHALLNGEKIIHGAGSVVYLVPSPNVRRLLELVSAEPLMNMEFTTVVDAVEALRQSPE